MSDGLYRRAKTNYGRKGNNEQEIRKRIRTPDRAEAKRRVEAWQAETNHAALCSESRMMWQDAVARYMTEVVPGSVKLSTSTRYQVSLRQVGPHLKDAHIDALRMKDIAALVSKRNEEGAVNATIKRDLTAISRIFSSAQTWGCCEHNPALEYLHQGLLSERRDPIRLPTLAEVLEAAAKAPESFRPILEAARLTGMRQNEIISMHPSQVDMTRMAIILDKTKTDAPRVIALTGPILADAVGPLRGTLQKNTGKHLFPNQRGGKYTNFSSNYNQWAKRVGVRFRFHDLRHFFAVEFLRSGRNIYELQQTLGHKSLATTEIYLAYLTPVEQDRAKFGRAQE